MEKPSGRIDFVTPIYNDELQNKFVENVNQAAKVINNVATHGNNIIVEELDKNIGDEMITVYKPVNNGPTPMIPIKTGSMKEAITKLHSELQEQLEEIGEAEYIGPKLFSDRYKGRNDIPSKTKRKKKSSYKSKRKKK